MLDYSVLTPAVFSAILTIFLVPTLCVGTVGTRRSSVLQHRGDNAIAINLRIYCPKFPVIMGNYVGLDFHIQPFLAGIGVPALQLKPFIRTPIGLKLIGMGGNAERGGSVKSFIKKSDYYISTTFPVFIANLVQ